MLSVGIVGLPNVGKSTLFNAITNSQSAEAANYPFCTIDPNKGIVDVNDSRLSVLSKISKSQKIVKSSIEFVDIAGLVKGASKGEGLGNKFLSNIREVDAIVHVIRCFDDENIVHVDGSVDPMRDLETINLELIFADMDVLSKARDKQEKLSRMNKDALVKFQAINRALAMLGDEQFLYNISDEDKEELRNYNLLTLKPFVFAMNVKEDDLAGNKYTEMISNYAKSKNISSVIISSRIEYEISTLPEDERALFLETLGLQKPCLDRLVDECNKLLDLICFFTTGEQETRSWSIKKGDAAHLAASKIHSDIQRGFIRAEVASYKDYVSTNGNPKEKGLLRSEGKTYKVEDGDVIHFRFNV
jgi:GTP-binding protein YchF